MSSQFCTLQNRKLYYNLYCSGTELEVLMKEIWKDIEGFEGYQVSNMGRVKSLGRLVERKTTNMIIQTRILKPSINMGYHYVCLQKDKKSYFHAVHRLVGNAFIPNPDGLPCINHKDENPSNNLVNNLEWCTSSYNNTYKDLAVRNAIPRRIPVLQYTKDGQFIREWTHAREAAESLNLSKRAIYECCCGRSKTSGGFIWKRKEKINDKDKNI